MPLEPLGLRENVSFWPFSVKFHSGPQRQTGICDTISSGLHLHGRSWIRECLDNHKSCQPDLEALGWVPERLIRVHQRGEWGHYGLQLIVTSATPADGRYYTTLSHRWSSQSFLKLTHNNFQQLSREFTSSDLPQTFRDAVSATYPGLTHSASFKMTSMTGKVSLPKCIRYMHWLFVTLRLHGQKTALKQCFLNDQIAASLLTLSNYEFD